MVWVCLGCFVFNLYYFDYLIGWFSISWCVKCIGGVL